MRAGLLLLVVVVGCTSGSGASPTDAGADRGAHPDAPAGPLSPCPFDGIRPSQTFPVPESCPDGYYQWLDRSCGPPRADAGPVCGPSFGDGRCYRRCNSDYDCVDPAHPYCSVLGIFFGGDSNCGGRQLRVCRCKRTDDCPS